MKDTSDSTNYPQNSLVKKSLLRVIREKCLDCCGYQHSEVRRCHITDCPLWEFRMGKNPFHKRTMNDEQRKIAPQNLNKLKRDS